MVNAVEIVNLVVKFGDFTAVDNISFTVKEGEIFGFLGANGAGKTTAIRVMCGLLIQTSGKVRIAGLDTSSGLRAVKEKVGYMSQKFTLYDDLTVLENLEFKAAIRNIKKDVFIERKDKLLEFVGFSSGRDSRTGQILVRELPLGVKQQIALCAALLHEPAIIFLDEPTAGVSPAVRAKFWRLIKVLAEEGKTVFVTTHYMDEANNCGRVALMSRGKILALDTPEALKINVLHNKNASLEDVFIKVIREG